MNTSSKTAWLKARQQTTAGKVLAGIRPIVQCEEALSTYGLLGKHPTTGGVIASPFVQMSQTFQKQANLLWYEIFDIVKQNCTTKFDGSPQDDLMEQLLRSRK